MGKRILALILPAVLIFGLGTVAFAQEETGAADTAEVLTLAEETDAAETPAEETVETEATVTPEPSAAPEAAEAPAEEADVDADVEEAGDGSSAELTALEEITGTADTLTLALDGGDDGEDEDSQDDHDGWTAISTTYQSKYGRYRITKAGNYYLDQDITGYIMINASGEVTICLNGHTLTDNNSTSAILFNASGITLTIEDCQGSGVICKDDAYTTAATGIQLSPNDGGTLIMNGGTISNFDKCGIAGGANAASYVTLNSGVTIINCSGSTSLNYGGGVSLTKSGSTLTINGATIQGCSANAGGGVYVDGTFTMDSGTITYCSATGSSATGGGVFVTKGTFTMNGGTISYCTAAKGGGIYLDNTDFTMGDGSIIYNSAYIKNNTDNGGLAHGLGDGGGIYQYYGTLTMNGGIISNNHADCSGGGIEFNDGVTATIYAGSITNNKAEGQGTDNTYYSGGGIYVNQNCTLQLYNAIVSDNTTIMGGYGGGIAACPTSSIGLYFNNGGIVYNNTDVSGIADEIYIAGTENEYDLYISNYYLGGGRYNWTDANGNAVDVYSLDRESDIDLFNDLTGDEDAVKTGLLQATVYITGNTGLIGGGLGSNGTILIGYGEDPTDGNLTVSKTVSGDRANRTKEFTFTVTLYTDDSCETVYEAISGTYGDMTFTEGVATFTLKDGESATASGLPDGTVYAVSEDSGGYTPSVTSGSLTGTIAAGETAAVTVNNDYETTGVTVSKTWSDSGNRDGLRPTSVTVTLLADGDDTGLTLTLSEDNNWTGSFTGLAKYSEDGQEIVYTVEEASVTGYTTVITGDAASGFTVTNSHTPATVTISGSKTWDDSDDQDGVRPDSIVINLLADGVEVDSATVTAEDDWAYSFTGLAKYRDGGVTIVYTVTEDAVTDYTTTYDGYDVTNSYTPGQTSVTVTKAWDDGDDADGIRPESVTVTLMADGEDTGLTLTLSADNNWTGSFTGLDEYASGVKIVYTIKEASIDGYTAAITGDAASGFVVKNSHTPTPTPTPTVTPTPSPVPEATPTATPNKAPATGDGTNIGLYASVTLLCLAALSALILRRKYTRGHGHKQ